MLDRFDRIAAYSRVMSSMDALLDVEANENAENPAFEKLEQAYRTMEEAAAAL